MFSVVKESAIPAARREAANDGDIDERRILQQHTARPEQRTHERQRAGTSSGSCAQIGRFHRVVACIREPAPGRGCGGKGRVSFTALLLHCPFRFYPAAAGFDGTPVAPTPQTKRVRGQPETKGRSWQKPGRTMRYSC